MSYNDRQKIIFTNNTDLPVVVSSFKHIMKCLQRLEDVIVRPGQTIEVTSTTCEWFLSCVGFTDDEDYKRWDGYYESSISRIGKFRSEPCAVGDYSWMNTDTFDAIYKDNTITFTRV